MFSVIYCQLHVFWTRLFLIPCYFELIILSLHLKSTLLFLTCQRVQEEFETLKRAGNIKSEVHQAIETLLHYSLFAVEGAENWR